MNKQKVDFSNVFSPKSQKVIAKRKSSLSPPVSPTTKAQREFVTNVPTIERYKQMNKLRLSDNNMQNILETLEIQTKANQSHDHRIKTNKLYLNYTHNPLTNFEVGSPLPNQKDNILNAIEKLSQKDPARTMKARISPQKSQIKDLCVRLKKRIQKNLKKIKRQQKENIIPVKHPDVVPQVRTRNPFEQLDYITTINQEYFFSKTQATAQRNIFQLIHNKNHPNLKSNKEILGQYYFCNDSMWLPGISQKKTVNKLYLNHLECISSFSRELARGVIPKKIPEKLLQGQGDIAFNLEQLHYQDIMAVATNKLTSRALREFFREEEQDLQKKAKDRSKKEQADTTFIIYAHSTRNRCDNYNPINQDKTEIQYFHKSPLTAFEKQQEQVSKKHLANLKRTIKLEAVIINNSINDEKVLAGFKKSKEKALIQHLQDNVDKRLTLLMKEVERKIRMNKMNKNRTEKIKIQLLTQSFRMKRALQTATRSKEKKDNRFSPLKTWRG